MLRRWRKGVVGLDIGSSAVKAVELRHGRRACSLAAFAVAQLPAGAVDDGSIADRDAVVQVVRTLLDGRGFNTRAVALALAGNAVMVRQIELPAMSPTELDASIYWEARQHVPFPAEEVTLDYKVLRAPGGPDAARSTVVLLVAARKDRVAEYTEVVERAGCTPVVIDVDVFALLNAYELNHGRDAAAVLALLDVGARATSVTVIAGGQPVGTRALPLGARSYLEALRDELGLGTAESDRILQAHLGDAPVPDEAPPRAAVGERSNRGGDRQHARILPGLRADRRSRIARAVWWRIPCRETRGRPGGAAAASSRSARSVPAGGRDRRALRERASAGGGRRRPRAAAGR